MDYCMVLVTCAGESRARDLGGKLVKSRLAACVQIHPVTSIYTWEDEIHTDPEFRMVVKTRTERYPEVEAFIAEHHGYEVPQILRVPIESGLGPYLDWMDDNIK